MKAETICYLQFLLEILVTFSYIHTHQYVLSNSPLPATVVEVITIRGIGLYTKVQQV